MSSTSFHRERGEKKRENCEQDKILTASRKIMKYLSGNDELEWSGRINLLGYTSVEKNISWIKNQLQVIKSLAFNTYLM